MDFPVARRLRRLLGAAIVFGVPLLIGGPRATANQPITWFSERAADTKYFQLGQRSVALDTSGHPHVAYGRDRLYYAFHSGAVWSFETVDATLGVGVSPSIAVDANDDAHIAYLDRYRGRVMYASNVTNNWVTEVVATGLDERAAINDDEAFLCSIALDDAGSAHIAYYDDVADELRYATNEGGPWTTELVQAGAGAHSAVAVDPAGAVHIAFGTGPALPGLQTGAELRHATNGTGAWVIETVDDDSADPTFPPGTGSDVGYHPSIAIDAAGDVHISHWDFEIISEAPLFIPEGNRLRYACNAGGSWTTEIVEEPNVGPFTSIAVTPVGKPFISYIGFGDVDFRPLANSMLKVATREPAGWMTRSVEPGGLSTCIAVQPGETIHAFHVNADGLRYVDGGFGSLGGETVEPGPNFGLGSSLALDENGVAHISHRGGFHLYYTSNMTGNFVTEMVEANVVPDNTAVTTYDTAIAVDSNCAAHIGYVTEDGDLAGPLFHATNPGGVWSREMVEADDVSATRVAIATDTADDVHLAYRRGLDGMFHATNKTGNWVMQLIAQNGLPGPNSLAVDGNDDAHVAYLDGGQLVYAENSSGQFIADPIVGVVGFGGSPSIRLDAAGDAHIAFTTDRAAHYATNTGGSWTVTRIPGDARFAGPIAVDGNGAVHIALGGVPMRYATNRGGFFDICTVDTGAFGGREFESAQHSVVEGVPGVRVTVQPSGPGNAGGASIALDAQGLPHFAYSDGALGDLKYAKEVAATASPVVTVDFDTADRTAVSPDDFTAMSGTLGWAADDTSSRCLWIPLEDDELAERTEMFDVNLSAPTGITTLGPVASTEVTITDVTAILPKKVRVKLNAKKPEKSKLVTAGVFDTGRDPYDLAQPSTLTVGGLEVSIPPFAPAAKGLVFDEGGVKFTLRLNKFGGSRSIFKLAIKRDLAGLVDPDDVLKITYTSGDITGESKVTLTGGRYFLGRARGALVSPQLFLSKAKAGIRGNGNDSLSLVFGLVTAGPTPAAAPDVVVKFGPTFQAMMPSGQFGPPKNEVFTGKGDKGGLTLVKLDFKKERMTVKAAGVDLGAFADGPQPVDIVVDPGQEQSISVRMSKKGRNLKY